MSLFTLSAFRREKQVNTPTNMQHPDALDGRLEETTTAISTGNGNEDGLQHKSLDDNSSTQTKLPHAKDGDHISIEINRAQQRYMEINEY
jgi:hypothetical protein